MALRILSISGLLSTCELAASDSNYQLLTNSNYPHKTAEKPKNSMRVCKLARCFSRQASRALQVRRARREISDQLS